MQHLFDKPVIRNESNSTKWGRYQDHTIPAWVADMDFVLAPQLQDHLQQFIKTAPLGYCEPSNNLKSTTKHYLQTSYGWQTEADWQVWMSGMVPSLYAVCKAFCKSTDSVLVPKPIYKPFRQAIQAAGLEMIEVPCHEKHGRLVIDADSIAKAAQQNTTLLLFCNPHNPGGSVYQQNELEAILSQCNKLGIGVISDEIHCQLLLDQNKRHICIANLPGGHCVRATFASPSKAYNFAGLACSVAIIPDPHDREKWLQAIDGIHPEPGILGQKAVEFVWSGQAADWHRSLLSYLNANVALIDRYMTQWGLEWIVPEASFLCWFNCEELMRSHPLVLKLPDQTPRALFEQFGVGLSDGSEFGMPHWARLNFGTQADNLKTILARMAKAFQT